MRGMLSTETRCRIKMEWFTHYLQWLGSLCSLKTIDMLHL